MNIVRFRQWGLLSLFVLGGHSSLSLAQGQSDWSLEKVLHKVVEANGGEETIQGTSNMRVRGRIINSEGEFQFLLLKKRPRMIRFHLMKDGRRLETGFDGKVAWQRRSYRGEEVVRLLSIDELEYSNLETDFDGPFVGPVEPGTRRHFRGVERIDRVDYLLVEISNERVKDLHFIDSRTFRLEKTLRRSAGSAEAILPVELIYSDYRRHDGLWIAHHLDRRHPDGHVEKVIVSEVEINPGILDQLFAAPDSTAVLP